MFSFFRKSIKIDDSLSIETDIRKEFDFDMGEANKVLDAIKSEFGLDYSKQEYIASKKIQRFMIKNDFYNFNDFQQAVMSSIELKNELINMLTVGETYFYREYNQIKTICRYIKNRYFTKVLSAPCSSGEEVYSILLALKESDIHIPSNFRITGIDINTKALEYAKKGCFRERSVSYLDDRIINAYFTKCENEYCIDSYFKQFARFYHQNIFDIDIKRYDKFDVILSRNMLIYFDDKQKKEALEIFRNLLSVDGILLLGHADISFEPNGFEKHMENGTVFYTIV